MGRTDMYLSDLQYCYSTFKEFQLYGTYWRTSVTCSTVIAPLKNSSYMGRTDMYLSNMLYCYSTFKEFHVFHSCTLSGKTISL